MYQDKGPQNGIPFHETREMKIKSWTKDFLSYEIIVPSKTIRERQAIFAKGEMKIDYKTQPKRYIVTCHHDKWYEYIARIAKVVEEPYDAIEMIGWDETYAHFYVHTSSRLDGFECEEPQTKIEVICRHYKVLESMHYVCNNVGLDISQLVMERKYTNPPAFIEDYYQFMHRVQLPSEFQDCESRDRNQSIKTT